MILKLGKHDPIPNIYLFRALPGTAIRVAVLVGGGLPRGLSHGVPGPLLADAEFPMLTPRHDEFPVLAPLLLFLLGR